MAQSVGEETNFAVIGEVEWGTLAKDCGVQFSLIKRISDQIYKLKNLKISMTLDQSTKSMNAQGKDFIYKLITLIDSRKAG
jgi:hypothetical protein